MRRRGFVGNPNAEHEEHASAALVTLSHPIVAVEVAQSSLDPGHQGVAPRVRGMIS